MDSSKLVLQKHQKAVSHNTSFWIVLPNLVFKCTFSFFFHWDTKEKCKTLIIILLFKNIGYSCVYDGSLILAHFADEVIFYTGISWSVLMNDVSNIVFQHIIGLQIIYLAVSLFDLHNFIDYGASKICLATAKSVDSLIFPNYSGTLAAPLNFLFWLTAALLFSW